MQYVITSEEIENMMSLKNNDNANIMHRAESIHKFIADSIFKRYSLDQYPEHIKRLHVRGAIHLHDLDYGAIRPVCCQHDPRFVFRYGLMVDGNGMHTSVSAPAMHIDTAVQHMAKIMATVQCEMSGGQSIDEFNVWLAPFAKGLTYKEVYDAMQTFVYELTQMYVARGNQTIFSSINLEIGIPDYLKDKPAIAFGKEVGVYGDYEYEANMIISALCDVMLKGDARGRMHMFPNFIVKLRKGWSKNEEVMNKLYMLVAKYGLPYFINMTAKFQGENTNAMGCRTRLSAVDGEDAEEYTLRTGNMQWYTVNMPRIAYQAGGDDARLFEILDERLEDLREALLIKRALVEKSLVDNKLMPFLTQKFDDEQYYRFDKSTNTFGFNGLNEMVKCHTGSDLTENNAFGVKIVEHMRNYADELKKETGLRWAVTQTPAESTAGRFAGLDYKFYKADVKKVLGDSVAQGEAYYSNSSHVAVDAGVTMGEKVKLESAYHSLCNGGHIMNFWSMDKFEDLDIIESVTKKIMKSETGYWTYTKNMTFCNDCGYKSFGINSTCKSCGSANVDAFSRITGYLQNVKNWNKAKVAELKNRTSVRI